MGVNAYTFYDDWRNAGAKDWEEAFWAHTEIMLSNKLFPEKTMIIGHWHAWRLAEKYGEKRQTNKHDPNEYINCDMFTYVYKGETKFIAIDGCSNWPNGGKVNCYVFETDAEPTFINGGLRKWYYFESLVLATGKQLPLTAGIHIVYTASTGKKSYVGLLHFDDNEVQVKLTLDPEQQVHYQFDDYWDLVQRGTNLLNALI